MIFVAAAAAEAAVVVVVASVVVAAKHAHRGALCFPASLVMGRVGVG